MRTSVLALLAFLLIVPQASAQRNVAYGSDPKQKLDIYGKKILQPRPVMVWVHGGAWTIGDKRRVEHKARAFTERGWLFVSLNYRLLPRAGYKEQVEDVARAIAWLLKNIEGYGGDPGRIHLMGHSSGAHITALLLSDPRTLAQYKLKPEVIKGAVLLDGAGYDIPFVVAQGGPRLVRTYERVFGTDRNAQRDASPISHVRPGRHIPPLCLLYVEERRLSSAAGQRFADKLKKTGHQVELHGLQGKTHRTINKEFGSRNDRTSKLAFKFLDSLPANSPKPGSALSRPASRAVTSRPSSRGHQRQ